MNVIAQLRKSLERHRLHMTPGIRVAAAIAATCAVGACSSAFAQDSDGLVPVAYHGSGRDVKVMIISMFGPEGKVWLHPLGPRKKIKGPGLSPRFPHLPFKSPDGSVMSTRIGPNNAAKPRA